MPQNLAEECVGSRTANTIAALANARESQRLGYAVHRHTGSDMLPVLNGLLDGLRSGDVPGEQELARKALRNPLVVAAAISALPGAIAGGHAPEFSPYADLFLAPEQTQEQPPAQKPTQNAPQPESGSPSDDSSHDTRRTETQAGADAPPTRRIGGGLIICALAIVTFLMYRAMR
ncbi:MAG: hypothetical protein J0I17_11155 ['Candidatus Kapabacteria' thiocyanatum]|mgnify:CR=1 FL=1|uniref:Uncharacterized protein n=1 Tax=Candidatus Kapaibacterium thiocyanatum TaxID=1895771 RepID=A0A1M3KZ84_9BACT|nr:hypothetical protein ['Candidatus Kapabacteria' thiocyanatum]OJX57690.1 MAG: hypothetical protein BGO89_06880 ['Candidatus Kapabacteria' thiocyanatum]